MTQTQTLEVDIQAALVANLIATPKILPDVQVAMPLVTFKPVDNTPYLDARPVLRAQPQHPALDFSGSNLNMGIFQVDAVIPDGQGEAPGLRLAEQVRARFALGTVLAAGSYKLQIVKSVSIAAAVKDAPWIRFPVSIPYLVIS